MPDISRLVIEVDAKGVLTASGNLDEFAKMSQKAGKSTDDLADKMGALQLVAGKLPGPLKSIASGMMGLVTPTTAAASAIFEVISIFSRFSKEGVEAYREQEVQLARLTAVMESTGAAAWTSTTELQNYAVSLRNTTGRSTNEIMQMQSVLLGFTGITGENFERLTKNMMNMADVMGGNLVSAANTFGRALENPTDSLNALTRQGFVFTEEQKRMVRQLEEAGRIQEAQVIYLEAMEKAFGNSAEATREAKKEVIDYQNALEDLKIAVGRWMERPGNSLKGVAAAVLDWYAEGLSGILDVIEERSRVAEAIRAFEAGTNTDMQGLIATFSKLKEAEEEYLQFQEKIRNLKERNKPVPDDLLREYRAAADEFHRWLDLNEEYHQKILLANEAEAERNRLQEIFNQLLAQQTKIENAYDDTAEGKLEKLERDIKRWRELRDSQWEVDTGVFEGLSDDYKRMIDAIIKNLEESLESTKGKAEKVKHEFADWVELLSQATAFTREQVEAWGGLNTVVEYAADGIEKVRDRFLAESPEGGLIYEILGLNNADVFEEAAEKMRTLVTAMTAARLTEPWDIEKDKSYQAAIMLLRQYEALAREASFEDAMKELDLRQEILYLSKEDLRIRELAEAFGDENRAREYRSRERNIEGEEAYVQDKGLLEEKQRIIWLAEERLRIEELTDRYVTDARAREIYALEQQIQKSLALKEALETLKQTGLNITASGLVDFARDLGSAFRDGTISSDELSGALGNMLRAMIDAMPQLLLNVGLQLIMAKQWALGLAFIGASGLMGFVSGMIDDADSNGRDDEAERLRRIQDQITYLIEQQRKQAEYYASKKRSIDSTASQKVNDAIITPKGVVYTHPEDWVIATKDPGKLTGNAAGGNVYINVENNAPVKVNTETEVADDGSKIVRMTVEQIVQSGIANGTFDGAFNAMNNRRSGRKVTQ